jgi:hypothetical protein
MSTGSGAGQSISYQPYFTTPRGRKTRRVGFAARSPSAIKRTVEYLSVCPDAKAYNAVIRTAPDGVVKSICNAALNVERGDIHLSKAQKALFRKHRQQIAKLTSRKIQLPSKRRVLEQRGGAFFIPALIGAALSGLAGSLFGNR